MAGEGVSKRHSCIQPKPILINQPIIHSKIIIIIKQLSSSLSSYMRVESLRVVSPSLMEEQAASSQGSLFSFYGSKGTGTRD